jgi:hypothetical protein
MTEVARVKVKSEGWPGSPGHTTYHFTKNASVAWSYALPLMFTSIKSSYTQIQGLIPAAMDFAIDGQVDICNVEEGHILSTQSVTTQTWSGTGATGFGPLATGICTTWLTAGVVAGKHVRGRTFLVPLGLDVTQSDGTPTDAALTAVAAYAADMIGVGSAGDAVVWSRPKKAVPPAEGFTRFGSVHGITAATVKNTFAVLRSRRD